LLPTAISFCEREQYGTGTDDEIYITFPSDNFFAELTQHMQHASPVTTIPSLIGVPAVNKTQTIALDLQSCQ
jgi:hypothetical protein